MLYADVGESVQRGFDEFAEWVPNLVAFLAILVIGYFVAKILGSLVRKGLEKIGLDRHLHSGTAGSWIAKVTTRPSDLLGRITFWIVFVAAISIALDALGIQALENFVGTVWAYIPNILVALLIFLVAGALATGVTALVRRTMGETATGKIIATVVPILIMAIAGFMILDQLRVAEDIVVITYAALMGAAGLGLALAFGLGGRDVAARMLEDAYDKGRQNREQWRRDFELGRERARQQYAEARGGSETSADGDTVAGPYQGARSAAEPDVTFEPDPALSRETNRPPTT